MLLCKNCMFKRDIPGDSHVSCMRKNVHLHDVNENGVKKGWFSYPFNFDPIWADSCDGYVSKDFDLDNVSDLEVAGMYSLETKSFQLAQKGTMLSRDENTLSEFTKGLSKKNDNDLSELSEKMRKLIRTIWTGKF